MAQKYELTFSSHPGEILALNNILLLEEHSKHVSLNISTNARLKMFKELKSKFEKQVLPESISQLCHSCAQVARDQPREMVEDMLEESLCSIEDTHVHHAIHPFLRPFFPESPHFEVQWANKLSTASAVRKGSKGHRPDFTVRCKKGGRQVEVVFGLFKSPAKCSPGYSNVDLVDLGILMKDSLDDYYGQNCDLDIDVFGLHVSGFIGRIYGMDLVYDGLYRMILVSEFEIPKSNISLSLVEGILYEITNFKRFVEEVLEIVQKSTVDNEGLHTPTARMQMRRATVATPQKRLRTEYS